jgi:putative Mg2+ transporter-C (MgtC) family protein
MGILATAFVLALPIAWDRERSSRSLGLRTFPLVAMASAGFVMVGQSILLAGDPAQARILQGVITGIGFLGGGAIVQKGLNVRGTATAASIWSTAAVGASVACGQFGIAIALSLANFLTLRWVTPFKETVSSDAEQGNEV